MSGCLDWSAACSGSQLGHCLTVAVASTSGCAARIAINRRRSPFSAKKAHWPDRSLPLELGCRAQLSFRKHLRSHGHWSVFISSVTCGKHREIGAKLFLSMLPLERAADAIFGRG
jgi:hypothetical protein